MHHFGNVEMIFFYYNYFAQWVVLETLSELHYQSTLVVVALMCY